MAKENVQIVFSADSQQARALFAEMSKGLDTIGNKAQATGTKIQGMGNSFSSIAAGSAAGSAAVAMLQKAIELLNQGIESNLDLMGKQRDAFAKTADMAQRLSVEGGLSPGQTDQLVNTVGQVSLATATPQDFVGRFAQQMLEDKFSPDMITGGGLAAAMRGAAAINGNGRNESPERLAKAMSNIMLTLGRGQSESDVTQTMQEMHGLLNATGLDIGGAEELITSLARASSPKKAKALALAGLKPEQIDPMKVGVGGAMQALYGATGQMDENEAAALLSRVIGDSGATALMRAKRGFSPNLADGSAYGADYERATGSRAALSRRREIRRELLRAAQGREPLDAFEAQDVMRDSLEAKGWNGGLIDAAMWTARKGAGLPLFGQDVRDLTKETARQWEDSINSFPPSIKVEITTPSGARLDGRTKGTRHLKSLLKSQ